MIINTGSRTDIPAYFSKWFLNRIEEGYVYTRNPYNPAMISEYKLDPDVVDVLSFCTKNPAPMLPHLDKLQAFRQFWHVTITPYGKDIEPHVPDKERVMDSFIALSEKVGIDRVSWRYDPIFLSDKYDIRFHIDAYRYMADRLQNYANQCVVSFIDLYEKTKRNFPQVQAVSAHDQEVIIEAFSQTAKETGIQIHLCCENEALTRDHVDAAGCFSKEILEHAIGSRLNVPSTGRARESCSCLLGGDIGAYNTCGHGCLYCYANYDNDIVRENMRQHDPESPLLIGHVLPTDTIKKADQRSWLNNQLDFFDLL